MDQTGAADDPAAELLDSYHQRASISEDGRMTIRPDKVLANLEEAMERIDIDINAEVAMEDVASATELTAMVQSLRMGPLLAVHIVNTGLRIMDRYPAELVRRPLPPEYQLSKIVPMEITGRPHDTAKAIFNRRTASQVDLTTDDVTDDLDQLTVPEQVTVIVALFVMYGSKIGALKYSTGTP